jgi:hypothetical protein
MRSSHAIISWVGKTKMALLPALFMVAISCGNNRTFDSTSWLKGDARVRGRMSEDLVKRKLLVGQTATEARALLGPPDTDFGSVLAYKIDFGWPFKDPVPNGLQVHLDENRRVREVRITD